jgi:epoxide hydrolase 4
MEFKRKIYPVNGINLSVIEEGIDGPVIIFLHGFPEYSEAWKDQILYFRSKEFRIIAPDQRGYNLSDKPSKVSSYKTEILAQDLKSLIEVVTSDKVFIVGHDWGAAVAWRFATLFPTLVAKLIIINVPHPSVMKSTLMKNPRQMMKSWYIAFFQIVYVPEQILKAFRFKFLSEMLLKSSNAGTFTEEDIQQYKKAWNQPGAIRGMINWYRAALRSKPLPQSKIKVPTLILWGAKDLALVEEMAKESLKYCENGYLQIFPDATHWVYHEKKEEVNKSIYEFINSDATIGN